MINKYIRKIDTGGRVVIPKALRDIFNDSLYVSRENNCLTLHSQHAYSSIVEGFDALPAYNMDTRHKIRAFFSNTVPCDIDSRGRIKVPEGLMSAVGINKEALFIHNEKGISIWTSDHYENV